MLTSPVPDNLFISLKGKLMRRFNVFFAVAAIATASLVAGTAMPAFASPVGTTFGWASSNFQGDGADPAVPFGVATSIAGSGVTVDSSVSVSPPVPPLFLTGGLDYVEFSITTDDGGYLNGVPAAHSSWFITGLNWGPGEPAGIFTGLIFLSFDIDGTYVPLDGTALGVPIVPNPGTLAGVTGADAIPIDVAGDPVDFIPFDTLGLTGETLLTTLLALGVPFGDALSVNSMHVGFETVHVPEPASMMLLGTGLAAVVLARRRRS